MRTDSGVVFGGAAVSIVRCKKKANHDVYETV
jgi:hypothetical protein